MGPHSPATCACHQRQINGSFGQVHLLIDCFPNAGIDDVLLSSLSYLDWESVLMMFIMRKMSTVTLTRFLVMVVLLTWGNLPTLNRWSWAASPASCKHNVLHMAAGNCLVSKWMLHTFSTYKLYHCFSLMKQCFFVFMFVFTDPRKSINWAIILNNVVWVKWWYTDTSDRKNICVHISK